MTKKEVQQRVLCNGKTIALKDFSWDEKTKTFSSEKSYLVLDFTNVDNCTFNTWSYCTFNTRSNCTFDTGFDCTFNTGFDCTFNTGSDCTFNTWSNCTFNTRSNCVIISRNIFQVIIPEEGEAIQICPYNIPGYISKKKNEDAYYMDVDGKRVEHIIADGILSRVVSKKKGVYKVVNHGTDQESYLIEREGVFSHGSTLQEAKEGLIYKFKNRDTSKYEGLTLESVITFEDALKMYHAITGACSGGMKYFVDQNKDKVKESYTVQEVIDLTKGQYNNEMLRSFYNPSK